jgi:hypothetical protein
LTTHLLKSAGEVVQRLLKSADSGFIVNTTWRFLWTAFVNLLQISSSCVRERVLPLDYGVLAKIYELSQVIAFKETWNLFA